MKAVITVTGKDNVGIVAKVATECSSMGANIIDISQSVLREYFAMIMLVELEELSVGFSEFAEALSLRGAEKGLEIRAMHEDIFNTMHHV